MIFWLWSCPSAKKFFSEKIFLARENVEVGVFDREKTFEVEKTRWMRNNFEFLKASKNFQKILKSEEGRGVCVFKSCIKFMKSMRRMWFYAPETRYFIFG